MPFLECRSETEILLEYLKLTSLGVIGAIVKDCDTQITETIKNTNILPKLIEIIQQSYDHSKFVFYYSYTF